MPMSEPCRTARRCPPEKETHQKCCSHGLPGRIGGTPGIVRPLPERERGAARRVEVSRGSRGATQGAHVARTGRKGRHFVLFRVRADERQVEVLRPLCDIGRAKTTAT